MASESSVRHLNGAYLTETGQAYTGQGKLERAILYTADAATPGCIVVLYDAANAGTTDELTKFALDPSAAGGSDHITKSFEIGREFANGVSAVITGTGSLTLVFG
jgi:hypothetical protein